MPLLRRVPGRLPGLELCHFCCWGGRPLGGCWNWKPSKGASGKPSGWLLGRPLGGFWNWKPSGWLLELVPPPAAKVAYFQPRQLPRPAAQKWHMLPGPPPPSSKSGIFLAPAASQARGAKVAYVTGTAYHAKRAYSAAGGRAQKWHIFIRADHRENDKFC